MWRSLESDRQQGRRPHIHQQLEKKRLLKIRGVGSVLGDT